MRISNRGGRGVLPIFLLLMILGIPLFAGGNGESEDGYDPKNELEKAANLIEEGRLNDAIGVLVDLARKDPEQMERVQKIILDIRERESEIGVLFVEIRDIIKREDLDPDDKLLLIEENINAIKEIDSDPSSYTWVKLSFVEGELRLSLDELRREEFFLRGNEKLAQKLYRDAVDEYKKGFIDSVFGESQTYEKYRDAETADDIGKYAITPERQKIILEAYKLITPEGERVIRDIGLALDSWDRISAELTDSGLAAAAIVTGTDPAGWSDALAAYIESLVFIDEEIQTVRSLENELDAARTQLYEELEGIPEDFRYARISSFMKGREDRESEGIIYAQEIQWEDSYIGILADMMERVRNPYNNGRTQFENQLLDGSKASFTLSRNTAEHALGFIRVAENHVTSHRDSGIGRFTDRFDPLAMELRYLAAASEIRSELIDFYRSQPPTDDAALAVLSLREIQELSDVIQDFMDLTEALLLDWNESTAPHALTPGIDAPGVREIDRNLRDDLEAILEEYRRLRVNIFILYMEPRFNNLDSDVSGLLEDSPGGREEARSFIDNGRPNAAMNQYIEPGISAVDALNNAVKDFLETVDDVLESSTAVEESQNFLEFRIKAETLLVLLGEDREEWLEIRTDAFNRRNAALRAETIAVAALDEAEGLIQFAREADTRGRTNNNINESYRAKDLYTSAGAALDRAGDLLIQVELNDTDIAGESGVRERLAELEAETLSAPRNLAVTVRDYAIAEADRAFTERRYGEGLSVLLLAQDFWVNIFGEEDTRLRERIVRFRIVQQSAQNTRIEPSDPLYMEMNQYLNLANRYYNEGVRLSPSGTSNVRNADATRAFTAAKDLVKQVTNVFPGNAAALLLEKKILKITEPNRYSREISDMIDAAAGAMRTDDREAIEGTDFETGLDPQLQAVYSFDPNFPGLADIVNRIDIYLGRVIPEPTQAEINESRRITTAAGNDWNQIKSLGVNAVNAASPGLIRRLDGALVIWEDNIDAVNLQDEIRFYTEPPALPENLRRLLDVAEDQKRQNNRTSVETIYKSIVDTYPSFLSHPEVLKLKNWLGID